MVGVKSLGDDWGGRLGGCGGGVKVTKTVHTTLVLINHLEGSCIFS